MGQAAGSHLPRAIGGSQSQLPALGLRAQAGTAPLSAPLPAEINTGTPLQTTAGITDISV